MSLRGTKQSHGEKPPYMFAIASFLTAMTSIAKQKGDDQMAIPFSILTSPFRRAGGLTLLQPDPPNG